MGQLLYVAINKASYEIEVLWVIAGKQLVVVFISKDGNDSEMMLI